MAMFVRGMNNKLGLRNLNRAMPLGEFYCRLHQVQMEVGLVECTYIWGIKIIEYILYPANKHRIKLLLNKMC